MTTSEELNGKVRSMWILYLSIYHDVLTTSDWDQYFVPWARISTPRKETQDPKVGEELWNWLEEQVKDV